MSVWNRLRNFTSRGQKIIAETGKKKETWKREQKGIGREGWALEEFVEYPEDLESFEKYYKENNEVNAAVNVLSDMTVGVGYFTESENEKAKEIVDSFAEEMGLDILLNRVVKNMLIYGFCPIERWLKLGRPPQTGMRLGLKALSPKTVKVRMDKKGEVLGYRQTVSGSTVDFKPSSIVWCVYNQVGTSPYGMSITQPILNLLEAKESINEDMPKVIHRYGSPLTVWETSQAISALKQAVTEREPDEDVFLGNTPPDAVRWKTLEMDPRGRFADYIKIIDEEILECLQAPILRYLRNATEASATKMLEVIDRHIQGLQRYMKRVVEREMFSPLLAVYDIWDVPSLRWGRPQTGLENISLTDIANLTEKGVITPLQGVNLLKKIGVPIEDVAPQEAAAIMKALNPAQSGDITRK